MDAIALNSVMSSAYPNPTSVPTELGDVAFTICSVYPILACRGLTREKCQDEGSKTLLARYFFDQHPQQEWYDAMMFNHAYGNMVRHLDGANLFMTSSGSLSY